MFRFPRRPIAPGVLLAVLLGAFSANAEPLHLLPNTSAILDHIYSGERRLALKEIRELRQTNPDHPLPYLLEAELEWWKIWCESAEYRYGMTMARHREKSPADQPYLELARKAYTLAEAGLRQQQSGEMHLYAGMADALEARMYGLRGEPRATARVGVRGREHLLKALEQDPSLVDADTGLGLYNYYVDTLSAAAKVLRFFMGVPGGSKEEGVRQLNRAIETGQLTPAVARFYLALNLENYDQRYAEALRSVRPLVERYPHNPMYLLVQGDLYAKLGRTKLAENSYRTAFATADYGEDSQCNAKIKQLAREALAAIGTTN